MQNTFLKFQVVTRHYMKLDAHFRCSFSDLCVLMSLFFKLYKKYISFISLSLVPQALQVLQGLRDPQEPPGQRSLRRSCCESSKKWSKVRTHNTCKTQHLWWTFSIRQWRLTGHYCLLLEQRPQRGEQQWTGPMNPVSCPQLWLHWRAWPPTGESRKHSTANSKALWSWTKRLWQSCRTFRQWVL